MAAMRLPAPGTTFGPCESDCTHVDCYEARKTARTACKYCDQPIGYDALYVIDGKAPTHLRCALEGAQRRRSSRRGRQVKAIETDDSIIIG